MKCSTEIIINLSYIQRSIPMDEDKGAFLHSSWVLLSLVNLLEGYLTLPYYALQEPPKLYNIIMAKLPKQKRIYFPNLVNYVLMN